MRTLFKAPQTAPIASPMSSAGTCPKGWMREIVTTATRLIVPATDRSMKPPMITKVMPSDTMMRGPNWRMMLTKFAGCMNLGSTNAVIATSAAIITSTR